MSADNDPSMDDILASIRKIISDDEARAQVSGNAMPPSTQAANAPVDLRTPQMRGIGGNREDVLLLTDLIEEPPTGASTAPSAPTPLPVPRIDPSLAGEMPQPSFEPAPAAAAMPLPTMMPPAMSSSTPPSTPSFDQPLAASNVAGAATSAFDRLNQAVEEHNAGPAEAPATVPALGAGGKTIEDLVKEMLRPMLKDWIDRSLPPMVERLVEREIARLTRR